MDIKNPRRILCLGPPDSGVLSLLKDLTHSVPTPDPGAETTTGTTTTAGLSHTLDLKTRYYTATIPIWLDEITDPEAWEQDFLREEAEDVVRAVGAWVVVFKKQEVEAIAIGIMKAAKAVVEKVYTGEGIWEGVCLAIGMPSDTVGRSQGRGVGLGKELDEDGWEGLCFDEGFEYIEVEKEGQLASGRNENGETRGVERVQEALEANDWNGEDDVELNMELLNVDERESNMDGLQEGEMGFELERAQMEREFMGLKMAMNNDSDEGNLKEEDERMQVETLERMMLKMQAVKDMSAHMSEQDRKKFAAKAVNDLMKTV